MDFEGEKQLAAQSSGLRVPEEFEEPEELRRVYLLALKHLSGHTSDNPLSVTDLSGRITSEAASLSKSVYHTILAASKHPESPIQSRKGRGGGYFISEPVGEAGPSESYSLSPTALAQSTEKTNEKHLWPLVAEWLKTSKDVPYTSSRIAHLKSGGKWGNPDVIGLSPIDRLGFFDVEIVSVEVKQFLNNWEYFVFEAVAHKRFAERVYFAYRTSGGKEKSEDELMAYAEKFGIGLLRLEIVDEVYSSLPDWDSMPDEKKAELLELVVEAVPAPSEAVRLIPLPPAAPHLVL